MVLSPLSSCVSVGPCLLSLPMPRPITANKASLSLQFDSKWIVISEFHWQTDNRQEKEEKDKKRKEEKEEERRTPVIKEKGKTEEEEKAKEKVIRVESEIEYRRDMPDSKTEVPAREVVGMKEKKEEEEEEERQNEVEEEEPEVDTDSLVQVCVYPHLD